MSTDKDMSEYAKEGYLDDPVVQNAVIGLMQERSAIDAECFIMLENLNAIIDNEDANTLVCKRRALNINLQQLLAGDISMLKAIGWKECSKFIVGNEIEEKMFDVKPI